MPLPVDNLVSMINAMNTPKDMLYCNLPGIVVRINKEEILYNGLSAKIL
jgi:hypothetical protein